LQSRRRITIARVPTWTFRGTGVLELGAGTGLPGDRRGVAGGADGPERPDRLRARRRPAEAALPPK
ncbi:MAG TPA: hypothetical protein VHG08_23715, partial [Longimicrobium sp.]|nr:hypothetical protein [Longimicrobium sp.]